MPVPALSVLLLGGTPTARAADPCEAWGEIDPQVVTAHLDEQVRFFIDGGSDRCGDVSTCSWWFDETTGLGELDESTGSPETWTSPSELPHCISATFRLFATCEDGDTLDRASITVQCDEDDKAAMKAAEATTTLSGGGCNSPRIATSPRSARGSAVAGLACGLRPSAPLRDLRPPGLGSARGASGAGEPAFEASSRLE